jgi:hypothetical protein
MSDVVIPRRYFFTPTSQRTIYRSMKARLLSAEFSNLSPEDVAVWQKASADDRARFTREMELYVPPDQVSGSGDADGRCNDSIVLMADDEAIAVIESGSASKKSKKGEELYFIKSSLYHSISVIISNLCLPCAINSAKPSVSSKRSQCTEHL